MAEPEKRFDVVPQIMLVEVRSPVKHISLTGAAEHGRVLGIGEINEAAAICVNEDAVVGNIVVHTRRRQAEVGELEGQPDSAPEGNSLQERKAGAGYLAQRL